MTIKLNHSDRLNLRSIIGQYRGWTAIEVRRVWALMDKIDLSDEEKQAINYREVAENGQVREAWDAAPLNPPEVKEIALNDRDVARIKTALANFPHAGNDRRWIRPLLDLFLPEEGEE